MNQRDGETRDESYRTPPSRGISESRDSWTRTGRDRAQGGEAGDNHSRNQHGDRSALNRRDDGFCGGSRENSGERRRGKSVSSGRRQGGYSDYSSPPWCGSGHYSGCNSRPGSYNRYGDGCTYDGRNTQALNSTMKELRDTLSRTSKSKPRVDTNYILTKGFNFRLWEEQLRSELLVNELLDVIDSNATTYRNNSFEDQTIRDEQVRCIIISRLDSFHFKLVLAMEDPREMVEYLKNKKEMQANLTARTVRKRLGEMRVAQREAAVDFIERFEGIVLEYNSLSNATALSSSELTVGFQIMKNTLEHG